MNTQILLRHFGAVLISFFASLILGVSVAQAAPPGYTYEVLWEGVTNQNFPTEEGYCPGVAINNRGAVVFRTGAFVSFFPFVERIRVYLAERGQAPALIYETLTNNADPAPSGIPCRIGGLGGLGINDDGVVAVQAQWVDVDAGGNIVATNDYGFVLIQPGVGVIRELRGLMNSTGRVNNNLQMAGQLGAALVVTDGITIQSSGGNDSVGGYVNVNSSGTVAAGGVVYSPPGTFTTAVYRAAPPGLIDIVSVGDFNDIGHTTFYTPGINDQGWTSFSTNTDGNGVNPNPRILLISPAGSIFPVAEANTTDFGNFFQTRNTSTLGTSLNNFNRVSFVAQLDSDTSTSADMIYVSDASGDPARVAVDNDIELANGNRLQNYGWGNDVADHGVNSMNDAGELAVSAFGPLFDSNGVSVGGLVRQIVLVSRPVPGMEPGNPILPDPADALPGGGWLIRLTCQLPLPTLPISHCTAPGGSGSSTSRTYVDPPIAIAYDYEMDAASAGSFTSVLIPVPLAGGDANFTVEWFNGNSVPITAGTVFEFASVSGDPVSNPVRQFRISGIDPGEGLDPGNPAAFVTGLTFFTESTTTEIAITMIPVVDDTTDSDSDGIGDSLDNCPAIPNANQLDDDQDDVGNACDVCPATATGANVDAQGCSEPQRDDDGDGVANASDLCPGTAFGATVDADGCSEAQKDDDGDGVANPSDLCPGTAFGATVDADGCSEAQKDDDDDGVANPSDLCPGTAFGATVDADGCSEAQKDDDGDGVFNNVDLCPGTLPGTAVGSDGCPVVQEGRVCDVDLDNDVDKHDIRLILESFWQPASGPNDPRDANHNGKIDLRDALICTNACDLRFCKSP